MQLGRLQSWVILGIWDGSVKTRGDIRRLYWGLEEDPESHYEYPRCKGSTESKYVRDKLYAVLKRLREKGLVVEDRSKPPWERVVNKLELTEEGREMAEMIDDALKQGRVEVYRNHIWIQNDYGGEFCADDIEGEEEIEAEWG